MLRESAKDVDAIMDAAFIIIVTSGVTLMKILMNTTNTAVLANAKIFCGGGDVRQGGLHLLSVIQIIIPWTLGENNALHNSYVNHNGHF